MQTRLKYQRQSQRHAASLSPKQGHGDSNQHKDSPFRMNKGEGHHRRRTHQDWLTDWDNHSSRTSSQESNGGLLSLKGKDGWTGRNWQQGESDERTNKRSVKPTGDLLSLRNELMQMHEANITRRLSMVSELQKLLKQRSEMYTIDRPSESIDNATGMTRQDWIQEEMERMHTELAFKAQVEEILRTSLLKMKAQKMKFKSMAQFQSLDSSKSMMDRRSVESQEIQEMESEIAELEGHLKLLNDALDDEKQENYELAKHNAVLKQQVDSGRKETDF